MKTLSRYNTDGSLDATFGTGGKVDITMNGGAFEAMEAVAVQADGKIVVAGHTSTAPSLVQDFALQRFNTDGSLDEAFGDQGIVMTDYATKQDWAYSMVLRPDGKIVLAGPVEIDARLCGAYICSVFGYGFAQYNTDGSP